MDNGMRTRVVGVGNQKGGVGKTTNCVHLAAALAERGRKCLIWDLDMNSCSTEHFNIPDNMSLLGTYEVLMGEEEPSDVIVREQDLIEENIQLPTNVHLLPARRNLEGIDEALSGKYGKFIDLSGVLKKPLESLSGQYDYIFLDTAPNLTKPTISAYKCSQYFLLSAMPEMFAIKGLNKALKDIQTVRERGGNPNLVLLGVVLSNVDGKLTRLARELLTYVETTFAEAPPWMQKYKTTISRTTELPVAQKQGKTIFQTNPEHKVTQQYRDLASEFEDRLLMLESPSLSAAVNLSTPSPQPLPTDDDDFEESVANG
jgi:chromosome partitioning protein